MEVSEDVLNTLESYASESADTVQAISGGCSEDACRRACDFSCDESCWCESDMGF